VSQKGEELMLDSAELKGASAESVADTILSYVQNVSREREDGVQRRDGGPRIHIAHFIELWHEANQELEEDLRGLVAKHFGTELPKR
jgi:hypothetical protein